MRHPSLLAGFALLLAALQGSYAGTLAQFRTYFGDIEIELYDQDKPVTVQNFIRYVQSGAYQDGFAHRLEPGFVIQGGGYAITNRGSTNWQVTTIPAFPPITNEFAVGQRHSNLFGTIAMAKRGGDTNSATSQWFLNLANNTFLDAADTNNLFVVFGRVIQGTDILNTFSSFQFWNGSQTSNLVDWLEAPPFDRLPLLRPVLSSTNLLYFDVTLLQVAVENVAGGARKILWNSAAGLTNVVEFTTDFPPNWTTLISTNGTGDRMEVLDGSGASRRFYRVRVLH
jgi:cyclophilin family peptidyl-prolyl cis-trans isomerase